MKTENLSTLKIHKLTQEQYDRELAAGNLDETALYLTPDEPVDLSGYATLEQLNDKANVEHGHDDVYYTEAEIDAKLGTKADKAHAHNDIYYTKAELDAMELISVNDIDAICALPTLITFNIMRYDEIGVLEYQAEEGMTWVDWCDSKYNIDGFVYASDDPESSGDDDVIKTSVYDAGECCKLKDVSCFSVINPQWYVLYMLSEEVPDDMVEFTINESEEPYTADMGMTWNDWCTSTYNSDGITCDSNGVYVASGARLRSVDGVNVTGSMIILPTDYYSSDWTSDGEDEEGPA